MATRFLTAAVTLSLVFSFAPRTEAQHGGSMNMTGPGGVLSSDPCVLQPSRPECEYYHFPMANTTADLNALCTAMPFMSACTIRDMCEAGAVPTLNATGWCKPFSLVAHVCSVDEGMSRMKGCVNYNSMCNETAGSVVIQCEVIKPLPNLPSTKAVNAEVKSICEEMPDMQGCEKCSFANNVTYANCDLLGVYSQLCRSMPTHTQCFMMNTLCAGPTGTTSLCSGWTYTQYQGQTSPPSVVTQTNGVVPTKPTSSMTVATATTTTSIISTSRPSSGTTVGFSITLGLALALVALRYTTL
ncbi:hypothetical protein DFJ74DRAFT_693149 [Hyaloraphidium curvatum]|nr:hypothetical protein DFJ74DRAFT_693149 [Hyaloraphidium curvatum]